MNKSWFIRNEYSKEYFKIVRSAKCVGRTKSNKFERHHIKPKSVGGIDNISNIVLLTFEEHFRCHWLLTKCTSGIIKRNMCFALHALGCMINSNHNRTPTIQNLADAREANRGAMYGNKNGIALKGVPKSLETRKKMSLAAIGNQNGKGRIGYINTEATKLKMSESQIKRERTDREIDRFKNIWVGRKHSEATKEKMRLSSKIAWERRRQEICAHTA